VMGYKMHVVWEQDWEDRLEGKWQENRGVHSPSANDASCLFPFISTKFTNSSPISPKFTNFPLFLFKLRFA